MEHSQNIYGLFIFYSHVCIDVIITNSIIVFFFNYPNLLRSCSALHRLSYTFGIRLSDLLKWPSILHRRLIFFFSK